MTVKEMIRQLVLYPTDWQVTDANGSPFMIMRCGRDDKVRLKAKSEVNLNEWLDTYFNDAAIECTSERDQYEELIEAGITLEDLKNYRQDTYKWAKQYWEESDGNENME